MTMKKYTISIEFVSDGLPGSGEGFGAVIDSDIVFDDYGLPYLPAKRIKGCLRESADQVWAMLKDCKPKPLAELKPETKEEYNPVDQLFGKPGAENPAGIYFSNLTLKDYKGNRDALKYFQRNHPGLVSAEQVVQTFTYTRQSTAIDDNGIAEDHSLRTCRVLTSGICFEGTIEIELEPALELALELTIASQQENLEAEKLLALACLNFRRMGCKRNRGFGEIICRLYHHQDEKPSEVTLDSQKGGTNDHDA